jgi:hypothetical protein
LFEKISQEAWLKHSGSLVEAFKKLGGSELRDFGSELRDFGSELPSAKLPDWQEAHF